jgi:hypothetical protein
MKTRQTTFSCLLSKGKKKVATLLFHLIKWKHSWTILIVLISWLFFSNYQVNAELKQYETRLLFALNQHQSECLREVSVDEELCTANLAIISKLLDEAPMNTSRQALMWELGRLHLDNQWAIRENCLALTPRLANTLNRFYDYNTEIKEPNLVNSISFSRFLIKEYSDKLSKLNVNTK